MGWIWPLSVVVFLCGCREIWVTLFVHWFVIILFVIKDYLCVDVAK
jgi:hypothetical protein